MPNELARLANEFRIRARHSFWVCGIVVILIWIAVLSFKRSSTSPNIPKNDHGRNEGVLYRQRLVAIGDLHGDVDAARSILSQMKLLDQSTSEWVGGTDILVQTGDIVDRGTNALDIYQLMQTLRGQASQVGGKVVSILGNHEIMNAIGDWRYVTQSDIRRFGSTKKRQAVMSKEGWLGKEWLANYSVTAQVPLGPYPFSPSHSFTHGSLRPSYPNLVPYPTKINELGHTLLSRALTPPLALPHPPHPYSGLPKGSTREEAELYDAGGPLWWRGLAEVEDESVVCGWASELRQKTGARRIIGGHTPNFEKMVHKCNGTIIIIDTGISSAYGGVHSALEIIYTVGALDDQPHPPDHRQDPFIASPDQFSFIGVRTSSKTYLEREEVYAVYPDKGSREVIVIEERTVTM